METSLLNHWFQKVRVTYWVSDKAQLKAVRFCRNYGFDNKRIIGLSAVIYTAALRFARNRSGYFFAVIKSPKLIFISLKRTSFPIFRNAHLKWFRVIPSRKNFYYLYHGKCLAWVLASLCTYISFFSELFNLLYVTCVMVNKAVKKNKF